jgi:hypothetical protein
MKKSFVLVALAGLLAMGMVFVGCGGGAGGGGGGGNAYTCTVKIVNNSSYAITHINMYSPDEEFVIKSVTSEGANVSMVTPENFTKPILDADVTIAAGSTKEYVFKYTTPNAAINGQVEGKFRSTCTLTWAKPGTWADGKSRLYPYGLDDGTLVYYTTGSNDKQTCTITIKDDMTNSFTPSWSSN